MLIAAPLFLALAGSSIETWSGAWDLRAGEVTIFRYVIEGRPSVRRVVWIRPNHFDSDGETFSQVEGPQITSVARAVVIESDSLTAEFAGSGGSRRRMSVRFQKLDPNHLKVSYDGTGLQPLELVRAASRKAIRNWDPREEYTPSIRRSTNAEMTALFDADQADRNQQPIDWKKVEAADRQRLSRTKDLLQFDKLQSADDFYHAAFVFQHGHDPNDFLQAHAMAMVAIARGKPSARWIAAASLDRYLQTIGRPQIFGTQFQATKPGEFTQKPYDSSIVSDGLRKAMGVPPLAEQERQRVELERSPKH